MRSKTQFFSTRVRVNKYKTEFREKRHFHEEVQTLVENLAKNQVIVWFLKWLQKYVLLR